MNRKILRWILLGPFVLFVLLYIAGAIMLATDDRSIPVS